jgi:hypothetical protein
VSEAIERGRYQLQTPEPAVDLSMAQSHGTASKIPTMMPKPSTRPMAGASTMKISVLVHPDAMMAPKPAFATAPPA